MLRKLRIALVVTIMAVAVASSADDRVGAWVLRRW